MITKTIKQTLLVLAFGAIAGTGLVSCDKGTKPGERGEIKDAGEMVGADETNRYDDTTNYEEKYYDKADHDDHGENSEKALGDGAYDGKGTGMKRPEVGSNDGE
ncbi:hypothetical protein [Pontibacter chitinilyticus]|uniref:hypothetical protein n=1 Tax=Pontibacter chitinilyticus TaxID=2674989 RepID=UPI00321A030C